MFIAQVSSQSNSFQNEASQSWEHYRMEIVTRCVEDHLIPLLRDEIRRELVRIGREAILSEAALNFEVLFFTSIPVLF